MSSPQVSSSSSIPVKTYGPRSVLLFAVICMSAGYGLYRWRLDVLRPSVELSEAQDDSTETVQAGPPSSESTTIYPAPSNPPLPEIIESARATLNESDAEIERSLGEMQEMLKDILERNRALTKLRNEKVFPPLQSESLSKSTRNSDLEKPTSPTESPDTKSSSAAAEEALLKAERNLRKLLNR